jgi:CheY-like chemotaxis protein
MPGLNVLVVDDEVNIRKMLVTCLEISGHQVVAVSNSQDAISESTRHLIWPFWIFAWAQIVEWI